MLSAFRNVDIDRPFRFAEPREQDRGKTIIFKPGSSCENNVFELIGVKPTSAQLILVLLVSEVLWDGGTRVRRPALPKPFARP